MNLTIKQFSTFFIIKSYFGNNSITPKTGRISLLGSLFCLFYFITTCLMILNEKKSNSLIVLLFYCFNVKLLFLLYTYSTYCNVYEGGEFGPDFSDRVEKPVQIFVIEWRTPSEGCANRVRKNSPVSIKTTKKIPKIMCQ